MSTVAIAPTIVPLPPGVDPTALARKRRREILQSRAAQGVPVAFSSPTEEQSAPKKAKMATDAPAEAEAKASSETLGQAAAGIAGPKKSTAVKELVVPPSKTGGAKIAGGSATKTKPQPSKKAEAKKTTKASTAIASPAKKGARASSSGGGHQARYDPDVPMTKEEASAWRREARRVRNRESAAASRAKTRNRIAELEAEVAEWKAKYERVEARLRLLEGSASSAVGATAGVAVAEVSTEAMAAAAAAAVAAALGEAPSTQDADAQWGRDVSGDVAAAAAGFVSPLCSPVISSKPSPLSSVEKQQQPSEVKVKDEGTENGKEDEKMEEADNDTKKQEQQQPQAHLNETISRPAVKTGAMREQHVLQTSEFLLLPPPSLSIQDASPSPPPPAPSIITDDSSSTGSCREDAYCPSSSDVSVLTVPSSSSFDDDEHGANTGIFDRHEDDKEINHMDRQLLFDALNGLVSEDGDFGAVIGV